MSLLKALRNWNSRKENSDLKRVRVTSSGAFYMKSEDLFNNKEEALTLLNKLNKSVESFAKSNNKEASQSK